MFETVTESQNTLPEYVGLRNLPDTKLDMAAKNYKNEILHGIISSGSEIENENFDFLRDCQACMMNYISYLDFDKH